MTTSERLVTASKISLAASGVSLIPFMAEVNRYWANNPNAQPGDAGAYIGNRFNLEDGSISSEDMASLSVMGGIGFLGLAAILLIGALATERRSN